MSKEIYKTVDHYLNGLFAPHDEALNATEASIADNGIPQISVSPNQGKFLHVLAKLCGAKRILEIGTLAGYSTVWIARALPPNGRLISLEYEPLHADVARKNIARAGLDAVVEIRVGDANALLTQLEKEGVEPFDMIFIDADKPPYAEYFEKSLRLSRPGTLIVADNVIREGKVLRPDSNDKDAQGVKIFNEKLANHPAVTATILQTIGAKDHDGIALAVVN